MQQLQDAKKDYLTNCYTRDSLNLFLSKMEAEYSENRTPFSVLIIDVDHFKFYNDKYGHLCGDEVLKYFASSIRLDLEEETNAPFRFGGDEFIVVFPGKVSKDTRRLAERLRRNIRSRNCLYKGKSIKMGFSGGIACYPDDAKSIEELMERADQALYASKNAGRGRVVTYSTMKLRSLIIKSVFFLVLGAVLLGGFLLKDSFAKIFASLQERGKSITAIKLPEISMKAFSGLLPKKEAPEAGKEEPVEDLPPSGPMDVIHLKSGRILKGIILSETDEAIKLEVDFGQNKGTIGIKKSDVRSIDRGVMPAPEETAA